MRIISSILAAFLVAVFATLAHAETGGSIPESLKPSLEKRLSLFTQAQAQGRWDEVAAMLGRRRPGVRRDPVYTPAHTQCLISQIQSRPMTSFTVSSVTSFASVLTPFEKRSWILYGEATFRTPSGEATEPSLMFAYRDDGDWYFAPPNIDSQWEKTHYSEADFRVDRGSEIDVWNDPTCPLKITALHAHMDRKLPSLRHVEFNVRNSGSKKIKGFSVAFYLDDMVIQSSSPKEDIKPGASSSETVGFTAYEYFCEGIPRHRFVVDEILFADGSEWQSDNWKQAEPYDDADAYEIYNAILPHEETYLTGKGTLVISQTTQFGGKFDDSCFEGDAAARFAEALTAFVTENGGPRLLKRRFQIGRPYEIVSEEIIDRLFKDDDGMGGWSHFYKRFPHSGGFIHMSVVGFNKTKTLAVVYMGSESGNMGGSRGLHLLEKVNGKWRAVPQYTCPETS